MQPPRRPFARSSWACAAVAVAACGSSQHGKPAAASCVQVADHVHELLAPAPAAKDREEHAHDVREVFATRCEQDRWRSPVRACVLDTKSLKDPHHCKAMLPADQRSSLDRDLAAAEDRQRTRMPRACVEYERSIQDLMACDALPQATRDAMKQAFETTKAAWAKLRAEDRALLVDSCQSALEATRRTLSACRP